MNIRPTLLALAAAGTALGAQPQPSLQTPGASPLPTLIAEARTPATESSAEQLARTLPLLSRMPDAAAFAAESTVSDRSLTSWAVAVSGDMQSCGRLIRLIYARFILDSAERHLQMRDMLEEASASISDLISVPSAEESRSALAQVQALYDSLLAACRSTPVRIPTLYFVRRLRDTDDASSEEELINGLKELCEDPADCCTALEYKGWLGMRFRAGDYVNKHEELRERVGQDLAKLLEGVEFCCFIKQEGDLLRICLCNRPEEMQWPDAPEQSVLSDKSLARMSIADGADRTTAMLLTPSALNSLLEAGAEIARLSDANAALQGRYSHDARSFARIAQILEAIGSQNLSLVFQNKGRNFLASLDCGLNFDVNFRPGALSGLSALDAQTAFYFGTTPVDINFPGLEGNAADVCALLREGASTLFRYGESETSAALCGGAADRALLARLLAQMGGRDLDLSQPFSFRPFGGDKLCSGRIDETGFLLTTNDTTGKMLTDPAQEKIPFCGAVFDAESDAAGELLSSLRSRDIPLLSDMVSRCGPLCGTVTAQGRRLSLRLAGQEKEDEPELSPLEAEELSPEAPGADAGSADGAPDTPPSPGTSADALDSDAPDDAAEGGAPMQP